MKNHQWYDFKKNWLLTIVLLLSSCNGTPEFDLLEIKFQKDDVFALLKGEKYATYPNYVSTGSEKILMFNGLDLSKKQSGQSLSNFIVLYYKKDNKETFYYSIHLGNHKAGKALLKTLEEKFGSADYLGYEGDGKQQVDFKKSKPYKYIWEDKKDKRLFILYFSGENQIYFNVMVNPSNSAEITGMAQAGYWNDFIDRRAKINDVNYTYSQYLKDELKEAFPSIPTRLTQGKLVD